MNGKVVLGEIMMKNISSEGKRSTWIYICEINFHYNIFD